MEATGYNEALAGYTFTRGTKVIEVDDDDNEIASYPIIPQNESPEDAALRRQMLQHGLSEVGQVVAEIDLDERGDDYSDDEMDEDYDSDEEDEDEDEDQYGRSTRREVTDEYRQQMLDLETKLNARMLENLGPRLDLHPLAAYSDDVRKLVIQKDDTKVEPADSGVDADSDAEPKKKGVRFADNLDISPGPLSTQDTSRPVASSTPTISDTIVERSERNPEPAKAPRISRFKSSRSTSNPNAEASSTSQIAEDQLVSRGPSGRTIANTIVEHSLSEPNPQAPDEFDPNIINREVQTQYHKMRNTMIQQQGGFRPTAEDEDNPLVEERDGKAKKVSRFRAARMKADGL